MQPQLANEDRKVLHLNNHRKSGNNQQQGRREFDPHNGHEAILRTMIKKRSRAVLALTDGTTVVGRISQFDHFTITLYSEDNGGMPETFFKHGIRSFTCDPDQLDRGE